MQGGKGSRRRGQHLHVLENRTKTGETNWAFLFTLPLHVWLSGRSCFLGYRDGDNSVGSWRFDVPTRVRQRCVLPVNYFDPDAVDTCGSWCSQNVRLFLQLELYPN